MAENDSVKIFDEIQFGPEARQAIKYLVQDGRYDYIETGSLISIRKKSKEILIPSEEHKEKMYPMDFEEFLWATGDSSTIGIIREYYENSKPLKDQLHRQVMKLFRTYMVVGGMPQAVSDYVAGYSYQQIDWTKRDILSLYEEDLEKYDDGNNTRTAAVFSTLPDQLLNRNSHFKVSKVDKNARYRNYIDEFDFINKSMIGNICVNVNEPSTALKLKADFSNFKLFMTDTGLLITQILSSNAWTGEDLYKAIISDNITANMGMIFENMVAQILRTNGHDLYYHRFEYDSNKYEVDFLIVKQGKVCPIEVKSSSYKTHKSLDNFVTKYRKNIKIKDELVIYTKDLRKDNDVMYLPVYMTIFL